jgi:glycosyltransferase involved in cell wall biosynthesis
MPSVLLLCEYATLNGGERSMLSTLGGIARAGYQVRVAAPASGPLAGALQAEGVEVVPFEPCDAQGVRLPLDKLRCNLAEILKRHRPTLLHANSLAMGRLSGPVAAELSLPGLSHLRDIVSLSRQAIADLNCHARLLAVSEATRQFHVAQGLAAEKTCVLHNGIDLERFRPRAATGYLHGQLGLPSELPLIGTIGQISLRKGHGVLAAALAIPQSGRNGPVGVPALAGIPPNLRLKAGLQRLTSACADYAWLVIGARFSGKEESRQLEGRLHQAAAGPLAGRVHFLGVRDDVERILNELTLLVHPARQEPLGRVLLEGAAAGVAIVATDAGGTREIFPPQSEAACLVPPDDAQALAAAIARLLGDAAERRRLAENARKRAEQAFALKQAIEGLLGHYEELSGCP